MAGAGCQGTARLNDASPASILQTPWASSAVAFRDLRICAAGGPVPVRAVCSAARAAAAGMRPPCCVRSVHGQGNHPQSSVPEPSRACDAPISNAVTANCTSTMRFLPAGDSKRARRCCASIPSRDRPALSSASWHRRTRSLGLCAGRAGLRGVGPAAVAAHVADYAAALGDFLDSMRFRQIDVLGYQAGALIAAELAISRPQQVRRLVLASVPVLNDAEREQCNWRGAAGSGASNTQCAIASGSSLSPRSCFGSRTISGRSLPVSANRCRKPVWSSCRNTGQRHSKPRRKRSWQRSGNFCD